MSAVDAPVSVADGIDVAREQAAARGHELGAWHVFGGSLLMSRCARCKRSVWVGRRELFGLPLEVPCDEPEPRDGSSV